MSPQETAFRRNLPAFAEEWKTQLPAALADMIHDHLTRTDPQGYTLCFDGPQREYLRDHLLRWAATQGPAALAAVRVTFPTHQGLDTT